MRTTFLLILTMLLSFSIILPVDAYSYDVDLCEAFEHHGSILLIIDGDNNNIVYANKSAADFYGYSIEELEKMKIDDLNVLKNEEIKAEMDAAAEGKRNYFNFKHRLANGDIRIVAANSYTYQYNNKTLFISLINDITEQMQLRAKEKIFIKILVGIVVLLLGIGFLLFKSIKKLEEKNHEINNVNELRNLFINAHYGQIYLKDENLKYVFVNEWVKDFFKKDYSEIIGFDDFQLTDREFAEKRKNIELKVLKEKKTVIDIIKWDNKIFEKMKFPVKLLNGQWGVGGYARDITEEYNNKIKLEKINTELITKQYSLEGQNALIEELNAQLEEENIRFLQQKETLQAIIESLGAGVMMLDLGGNIIFINKAWKEMFAYLNINNKYFSKDSFYINNHSGMDTRLFINKMLMGAENKEELIQDIIGLIDDKNSKHSVYIEQREPIKRFLHLYSNPCISQENHVFGRIFVIRDISHEKEVDRMKSELITTVSHELRTPMSSLYGFSELLLTRELPEERQKEYFKIINSEAKRLTNLINNFLDIQRIESGIRNYNKELCSIGTIIEEAIKLFRGSSQNHRINYIKSKENISDIYCDKDRVFQVLSNLILNAIKYSPKGGEIKINLTRKGEYLKVTIEDQGLGIPKEVKDKVFDKFYRVDNDDRREIGGTGLGLSISKEIVEAHGGDIGVESTLGQGSLFYFSLPLTKERTK